MKLRCFFAVLIALVCLGAAAPAVAELRVVGSSTIFPIVKDAKAAFEKESGLKINLRGGGSEIGIAAVISQHAHVCMVSRDMLSSDNPNLKNYPIAYDGIALIVNKAIPVEAITNSQVVSVFSGSITNWQQVGGDNRKIAVIAKHNGHGTKTRFDNFFGLQNRITPDAFLFDSNNESIAMVGSDPTAIGYVSIGSAEYAIELKLNIKLLKLNGVEATSQSIAAGRYPLQRKLNLVTLGDPGPEAMQFIRFMQSEQGQTFVNRHHFVALSRGGK